ncbi:MAG: hypothetical protein IJY16_06320, partial [Clostridia bacterium]|nr:hypothetical protein [Clostridia bacterium]
MKATEGEQNIIVWRIRTTSLPQRGNITPPLAAHHSPTYQNLNAKFGFVGCLPIRKTISQTC